MKRKVRAFIFFFAILACALSAAFYLGWTQYKVPQGNIGIVVTKTNGVLEKTVSNERFSWHWHFLIPTNAQLRVFPSNPYRFKKIFSVSLPSAELYSRLLDSNPDFSYRFDFDITLKAEGSELVRLVKEMNAASEDDVKNYLEKEADALSYAIGNEIVKEYTAGDKQKRIELASRYQDIISDCLNKYSVNGIAQVVSVSVTDSKVPDMDIYEKASEAYRLYLDKVGESLVEQSRSQAEGITRFNQNLSKLEMLGEMLRKYPELNSFLKGTGKISDALNSIENLE